MKKIALFFIILLYVGAGVNHFWHPQFYLRLIPRYFPNPIFINYASGVVEVILGLLVFFPKTRKVGAIGIIGLLIVFIPSHIYSIQIACSGNIGCKMQWVAWIRFFIIHPLLITWAWWVRK